MPRLLSGREDYRWNSLGYHGQTNNQDNFLSTDFGLGEYNAENTKERIKRYRRYVYEAGAVNRPDKRMAKVIDDKVIKKERIREFELSPRYRFKYRTRYFTDSDVIGSKEFVSKTYMRFKHLFATKNEKKPTPVKGLSVKHRGQVFILDTYRRINHKYSDHLQRIKGVKS